MHHIRGPNLANQNNQKLGVFDRKLDGSNLRFYCYFDEYLKN